MPKALERKLESVARARNYSKEKTNAYVYGTLNKGKKKSKKKNKKAIEKGTTYNV